MVLPKSLLTAAVMAFLEVAGFAQVDKVEILTSGISCGVCAAVSEVRFRRMEGVGKVTISLPKETITLEYRPDARFSVAALEGVLEPLNVYILRIRMEARGRFETGPDGKMVLVAGKNRIPARLREGAGTIQQGMQLFVQGLVTGRGETMEYKVGQIRIAEKGSNGHETR
ncbi:MAG: heavy-metal-associated domain-containing protein [Acidobacteria bacterium]|nr:heavy-metal-associated domain-containing protein [Acidobacteriota bacterium]